MSTKNTKNAAKKQAEKADKARELEQFTDAIRRFREAQRQHFESLSQAPAAEPLPAGIPGPEDISP